MHVHTGSLTDIITLDLRQPLTGRKEQLDSELLKKFTVTTPAVYRLIAVLM